MVLGLCEAGLVFPGLLVCCSRGNGCLVINFFSVREKVIASRELDALVAEKVMGYRCVEEEQTSLLGSKFMAPVWYSRDEWNDNDDGSLNPPPFSTDISAAWEVVKELKDSDGAYGFALVQDQGELLEWEASFGNGKFKVSAESVPLAISLAALKTTGVEI